MPEKTFQSIAIIGTGLLGASLGLAIKERKLADRVIGIGRPGSVSHTTAHSRGALDHADTEPSAIKNCDLVIVAVNVGKFAEIFRQIAPHLKSGAIVTDVGSTKERVMRWAARDLPRRAIFVGSHPMAGSEKRGPEFARADLYQNALCLICPPKVRGKNADRQANAIDRVEHFWKALGMRTYRIDPVLHDRWVAAISHLPHAVASVLVNAAAKEPEAFIAIAGGFMDTTRIAAGDPAMWTDIFMTNRKALLAWLKEFSGNLKKLQTAIRRNDAAAVSEFLTQARDVREKVHSQK
ncbi:MAG TPA: prephenate dehydrogenase/arogenate dehydrogenase family protein [Phycisphaerae bacterium]|nr:prephenate dehydrogenase/arogenate dehydrogenase family protein [Phycisphaerae bacterium]